MTQATGPGGTVSYTYNGDGLKVRRVGPDGTRRYYYDGIRPIWEADGAGVMTAQLDRDLFGNLLSRREASGARRYYHYDGLGSTTALTSESGAVTATLLYDAWGNQRAVTGSDQGRYRFTGAELDQTTGLYHMGARFYDPTIGRWLSEDPKQDEPFEPATLNFYAYVNSNPVNFTDPSGLKGEAADSSIPPDWTCPGLVDTLSWGKPSPQKGVHSGQDTSSISTAVPRRSGALSSGVGEAPSSHCEGSGDFRTVPVHVGEASRSGWR
jgi:RHS repeat-associated protein